MKVTYTQQQDFEEWLKNKIRTYNNVNSKYPHEYRRDGSIQYINIKEHSERELIAGLHAQIYWKCMKIENLYVEDRHRRSGIGSKLLDCAIKIARSKNCSYIFLETYSFQALEFYMNFGFYIIGEIADYPPGESFYTMRLDLVDHT